MSVTQNPPMKDEMEHLQGLLDAKGEAKLKGKARQRVKKQLVDLKRSVLASKKAKHELMVNELEIVRCLTEDIMAREAVGPIDWVLIEDRCIAIVTGKLRRRRWKYVHGILVKMPLATYEDGRIPGV